MLCLKNLKKKNIGHPIYSYLKKKKKKMGRVDFLTAWYVQKKGVLFPLQIDNLDNAVLRRPPRRYDYTNAPRYNRHPDQNLRCNDQGHILWVRKCVRLEP